MKTAAIPAVRVSPELRQAAEAVLETGETLSGFVEDAVRRNVEFRYSPCATRGKRTTTEISKRVAEITNLRPVALNCRRKRHDCRRMGRSLQRPVAIGLAARLRS